MYIEPRLDRTEIQDQWKVSTAILSRESSQEEWEIVLMNGDSGDVDYLGDPLLCSIMRNLGLLPFVRIYGYTFVSSESCHIVAEVSLCGQSLLDAGLSRSREIENERVGE